jgi:hypothetical protein
MALSGLEGSPTTSNRILSGRLAGVLFVLSVAYLGVAMTRAPEISASERGMLFPIKLFLVASAPTVGGIAFLWSDRAISDVRRRRLMRILLVLLWAFASVTLVSLLS